MTLFNFTIVSAILLLFLGRPVGNLLGIGEVGFIFAGLVLLFCSILASIQRYGVNALGRSALVIPYILFVAVRGLSQVITLPDPETLQIIFHGFIALSLPWLIYIALSAAGNATSQMMIYRVASPLLLVSAALSVLYFYFDFTLWGAIQHDIYTEAIHENEAIERRAIGLLSSPQSHALSMVALFLIGAARLRRRERLGLIEILLSLAGGILSGSKAYLLGVLVMFAITMPLRYAFMMFVVAFTIYLTLADVIFDEGFRAFSIFEVVQNIDQYSATPLWRAALGFATNAPTLLFGLGVGVMGSISEALAYSPLEYSSTESYFLQLVVELGSVGSLLFALALWSVVRQSKGYHERMLPILPFVINGIFTPALYGVGNAVIFGLLLAQKRGRN